MRQAVQEALPRQRDVSRRVKFQFSVFSSEFSVFSFQCLQSGCHSGCRRRRQTMVMVMVFSEMRMENSCVLACLLAYSPKLSLYRYRYFLVSPEPAQLDWPVSNRPSKTPPKAVLGSSIQDISIMGHFSPNSNVQKPLWITMPK